jgi:hypothetical protein
MTPREKNLRDKKNYFAAPFHKKIPRQPSQFFVSQKQNHSQYNYPCLPAPLHTTQA